MTDRVVNVQPLDRVIRDGWVAVIVSPGFGAGWSTWAEDKNVMFSPDIVHWIEGGKEGDPPAGDNYAGGLRDAVIEWLPVGTEFVIDEYDGNESIVINIGNSWSRA